MGQGRAGQGRSVRQGGLGGGQRWWVAEFLCKQVLHLLCPTLSPPAAPPPTCLRHDPAEAVVHVVALDNLVHLAALVRLLAVHGGLGVDHTACKGGDRAGSMAHTQTAGTNGIHKRLLPARPWFGHVRGHNHMQSSTNASRAAHLR